MTPSINPAAIEKLRELGGDEFIVQMIDLYLGYATARVTDIENAAKTGDLEGLRTAAHPLKSSASNIGADQLRALATQLETAAAAALRIQIPQLAADLATEHARAVTELRTLRHKLAPA